MPAEENSEYDTVKRSLTNDESVKAFFEDDLSLERPDQFSEIREFILPRYQNRTTNHPGGGYFRDIKKILAAYRAPESKQKKSRLFSKLKSIPFLKSTNPATEQQCLRRPTDVYSNTAELREYFAGNDAVWFVAQDLRDRFDDKAFEDLLAKLGVATFPRRVRVNADLSSEERRRLRGGENSTRDLYLKDFELEGLDEFFQKEITPERSHLLWDLLKTSIESAGKDSLFQGIYKWKYYSTKVARFDARFCMTLKETPWIFDAEGILKKPAELNRSQLPSDYDTNSESAELLMEYLAFKSNVEEQLPEERKRILELADRYGKSPR